MWIISKRDLVISSVARSDWDQSFSDKVEVEEEWIKEEGGGGVHRFCLPVVEDEEEDDEG